MKTQSVTLVVFLVCVSVGHQVSGDDKPQSVARFVLGINRDESLTLHGRAVTQDQLAKEWPRLADRVREKAKAAGVRLDPKQGLPAVVVIWAADETPYSLVHTLLLETQKSGFRTHQFLLKSVYGDPSQMDPEGPTERGESPSPSELPALLRTLPIRIRADDRGGIGGMRLCDTELLDFKAFRFELSKIQDDTDTTFDQAILKIDAKLHFSEVVRVTDFLAKYRISKIDFIELGPEDED